MSLGNSVQQLISFDANAYEGYIRLIQKLSQMSMPLLDLAAHSIDFARIPDNMCLTSDSTMEPCIMCFGAILLSGIGKIIYAYENVMGGVTGCDIERLSPLYRNCSLEIISGILRKESLAIFKAYFSNPSNSYWKGSLLTDYTLAQKNYVYRLLYCFRI